MWSLVQWAINSPHLLSDKAFAPKATIWPKRELVLPTLPNSDLNVLLPRSKQRPLGRYFERLIFIGLLECSEIEIIAQGLQLFEGKTTIGEFDFLLSDKFLNSDIHLELAVKFYMQSVPDSNYSAWIGPNAKDSLALKIDKLLNHQLLLSNRPGVQTLFPEIGSWKPSVMLKGYFFYHPNFEPVAPKFANKHHLKANWLHLSEIQKLPENSFFVKVAKNEWIRQDSLSKEDIALLPSNLCISTPEVQSGLMLLEFKTNNLFEPIYNRWMIVADSWPDLVQ